MDSTPQEIELSAGDGVKPLYFFNDRKPGIYLVKVDSADPSKVIPNAKFSIEAVDGSFARRSSPPTKTVKLTCPSWSRGLMW